MITKFDKTNLQALRKDITEAMAAVEKLHGIKLQLGNISYSDSTFTAKITSAIANGDSGPVVNPKWKSDFDRNAMALGFKREDFGKNVRIGRETFVIVGAQPRKPTLILQRPNGSFVAYPASLCVVE